MRPRLLRSSVLAVVLALLATLSAGAAAAEDGDLIITAPAPLSVLTAGPVSVRGTFALSATEQVNVVYVVDVSSSTEQPTGQDCNGDGNADVFDDYNGDGVWGTTLDCEISGIVALNASLAGRGGVHVPLVGFATSARAASTFSGETFITPPDADTADTVGGLEVEPDGGVPDLLNIATLLDTQRIGLFTPRLLSAGTRFDPAVMDAERRAARRPRPARRHRVDLLDRR